MSNKYTPLALALSAQGAKRDSITLSFSEIESILGFSLPRSAHDHRPWWANQKNHDNRPQTSGWMDAGFQVESIDIRNKWVRFVRAKPEIATPFRKRDMSTAILNREVEASNVKADMPDPMPVEAPGITVGSRRIILISCAAKKLQHKAKARDLYVSPLFQRQMSYARKLSPDAIFILSAKYGLVDPDEEIEPYDQTLKDMGTSEQRAWAERVLAQLGEKSSLLSDHFIVLAGDVYRRFLTPALGNWKAPLERLTIGRQLQKLDQLLRV
ncbi:MAG: hypothetical protein KF853_10405 [Rhodocyclaceae bacterium]|nr:hypothetical protein [Rhodocyclaceae bacterium]